MIVSHQTRNALQWTAQSGHRKMAWSVDVRLTLLNLEIGACQVSTYDINECHTANIIIQTYRV